MSELPAGGSRAALFMSPLLAWVRAPSARFWLIPAFMAFVLLVPLLRPGLPVTQAGLLPLNHDLAGHLWDFPFGSEWGRFVQGIGWFKFYLILATILSALAVGIVSHWVWKSQGWWVAGLWLTLPLVISLIYQRGIPFLALLALSWVVPARFLSIQVQRHKGSKLVRILAFLFYVGVFVFFYHFIYLSPFWAIHPPLYPHQLFSGVWSPTDNWREWVGSPAYMVGVVPFGLGVLTALAAWPQRREAIGRRVFLYLGIATVCLILPLLLPMPITLLLIIAAVCLVVALGALPVLDTRYAAFPVQLGILAIALLSVYPYLRPAWFEELPPTITSTVFGNNELWLANLHTERGEGNIVVEAWWQSTATMPTEYTAFVHFLDDQEQIVAQSDALLVDEDNISTTGWSPGYVVIQRYTTPDIAAITHIRYGLYDRETLERLRVANRGTPEIFIRENAVVIPVTPAP